MLPKDYLKWYARSPLGIGSGFAGLAAALAGLAGGFPAGFALLMGSAIVISAGLIFLLVGAGPKSAIAARDAALGRDRAKKLSHAAASREKLARIRIAEGPAADAVRLVALAAGEYLDACGREGKDDPLADAALDEALDIVDIFQKEKDEAATEKRFGLEDADPFADAESRVAAALREKAGLLRERRIQIDGGLPASGRMSVREEIE